MSTNGNEAGRRDTIKCTVKHDTIANATNDNTVTHDTNESTDKHDVNNSTLNYDKNDSTLKHYCNVEHDTNANTVKHDTNDNTVKRSTKDYTVKRSTDDSIVKHDTNDSTVKHDTNDSIVKYDTNNSTVMMQLSNCQSPHPMTSFSLSTSSNMNDLSAELKDNTKNYIPPVILNDIYLPKESELTKGEFQEEITLKGLHSEKKDLVINAVHANKSSENVQLSSNSILPETNIKATIVLPEAFKEQTNGESSNILSNTLEKSVQEKKTDFEEQIEHPSEKVIFT